MFHILTQENNVILPWKAIISKEFLPSMPCAFFGLPCLWLCLGTISCGPARPAPCRGVLPQGFFGSFGHFQTNTNKATSLLANLRKLSYGASPAPHPGPFLLYEKKWEKKAHQGFHPWTPYLLVALNKRRLAVLALFLIIICRLYKHGNIQGKTRLRKAKPSPM